MRFISSVVFVMVVYRPFLNSVYSIAHLTPDYNRQNAQNCGIKFVQFTDKKVLDKSRCLWYNGKTAGLPAQRPQTGRRQKGIAQTTICAKDKGGFIMNNERLKEESNLCSSHLQCACSTIKLLRHITERWGLGVRLTGTPRRPRWSPSFGAPPMQAVLGT